MSAQNEQENIFCQTIREAAAKKSPLNICAGNTKNFYGNSSSGETFDVSQYQGIIDYEPSELFITARCGTTLKQIETELDNHNQMLAFEPPHFGEQATIGGTVACGLSGPRRPYAGAMRDNMLGVHIINGEGHYLRFGGQVMKNVAGYDVSRAMCGALGTLGVIMQVSLKVIPKPETEITLQIETPESQALSTLHQLSQSSLPISATFIENNSLYLRLAGLESSIQKTKLELDAKQINESNDFWHTVKEQQRDYFKSAKPLWRINVPNNAPAIDLEETMLIEWNGGLRWLSSLLDDTLIRSKIQQLGGHATLFKSENKSADCFSELSPEVKTLHTNLKNAFDPLHIINPGRMYSWC